jgi:hypothetical protein
MKKKPTVAAILAVGAKKLADEYVPTDNPKAAEAWLKRRDALRELSPSLAAPLEDKARHIKRIAAGTFGHWDGNRFCSPSMTPTEARAFLAERRRQQSA